MDRNGETGCATGGGLGDSDDWGSDIGTTSLSETIPEPKSIEEALGMVPTDNS